jgi:outer membrane protein OmpA-like peptidoglycan-associated protein
LVRHLWVLAAAFIAAGCACAPPVSVTPALFAVVPAADGHIGKIVVTLNGGAPRLIDTKYGAERIGADGRVETTTLTETEVKTAVGPTLEALPGRPVSYTLYFIEGRDELTPESKAELQKVLAEIKHRPLPDIAVIGHTDTVGGLEYNDKLSKARAERMREMLVEAGIPAERVIAAGRGKRELLVPTEENVSEPRNRRVEISVR